MGKTTCICELIYSLLMLSLIVTLVTLLYVGVNPKFYIQEIQIPSFKNPNSYNATNPNTSIFKNPNSCNATNPKINTSIIIDLKFKREVAFLPILYQDLNITLYYASGAVGHAVVPGFTQRKTAHRRAVVEARALPWEEAFKKISGGSTVALTAELATKYRVEAWYYYDREAKRVVAADLEVDASGADVSKKPIRLH